MLTLPAMNDAIMRTRSQRGSKSSMGKGEGEEKKKKKAPKIVSKAGGHSSVGLRGHQRHAGASRLEGNIHSVPFIACSCLC